MWNVDEECGSSTGPPRTGERGWREHEEGAFTEGSQKGLWDFGWLREND